MWISLIFLRTNVCVCEREREDVCAMYKSVCVRERKSVYVDIIDFHKNQCVCVCVRERERERERMCVQCIRVVCVCEREKECVCGYQ